MTFLLQKHDISAEETYKEMYRKDGVLQTAVNAIYPLQKTVEVV